MGLHDGPKGLVDRGKIVSVKQQRVKYLVGIFNALNETKTGADGVCEYDIKTIKQVLATVKRLLAQDGIHQEQD
jgi:hypothetical protein